MRSNPPNRHLVSAGRQTYLNRLRMARRMMLHTTRLRQDGHDGSEQGCRVCDEVRYVESEAHRLQKLADANPVPVGD